MIKMKKIVAGVVVALLIAACAAPQRASAQPTTQCVTNALAGGTGNALTVPLLPCGLATNILILTLSAANSSSSVTLQMVGFAALPIVNADGSQISVGALPGADAVVLLSGTGSEWLLMSNGTGEPISGSGLASVSVITGGTTVVLGQTAQIVVVANLSGTATTLTLPAAALWPDCPLQSSSCPIITIKNGTGVSTDGTITVNTGDGLTIDGASSFSLPMSRMSNDFFLQGTRWGVK